MTFSAVAKKRSEDAEGGLPVIPMVIRGRVIKTDLVRFQGRRESLTFLAPDPQKYVTQLALSGPAMLTDLYKLSFDDILDYFEALGDYLSVDRNEHMQWAREVLYSTSTATKPLIDNSFRGIRSLFDRRRIREMAERTIGLGYLNGWVRTELEDGTTVEIRAFGARAVHIIPGNAATSGVKAVIANAFTRSDSIIKTPSNNPFTAVAIARTMCDMAPDHPITRHLAVAYWRGGDEEIEQQLLQPHNVDKVIAWGGFASVKHVTRYIQPGLELIALDPKLSASVVEGAAIEKNDLLNEAALRLAVDAGAGNQEFCSAARTVFVLTRGCRDGLELSERFGRRVYDELVRLPSGLSTIPKSYNVELKARVESIRFQEEFYTLIGGGENEGCVIVSRLGSPVDFAPLLADRTVNIVPVDSVADVIKEFDAYTQTVGVFPEALKDEFIDIAPFFGVQRFVTLGYSAHHTGCTPHDGIELERRMCKWVVNQRHKAIPLAYAELRRMDDNEVSYVPNTVEAVRATVRR
jgi:hypothetical protein